MVLRSCLNKAARNIEGARALIASVASQMGKAMLVWRSVDGVFVPFAQTPATLLKKSLEIRASNSFLSCLADLAAKPRRVGRQSSQAQVIARKVRIPQFALDKRSSIYAGEIRRCVRFYTALSRTQTAEAVR
jgi:hypothetical protein